MSAKSDKKFKDFQVCSICRADLIGLGYSEKKVMKLDDSDMQRLASKIGDSLMEDCWISLRIIAEERFNLTKK